MHFDWFFVLREEETADVDANQILVFHQQLAAADQSCETKNKKQKKGLS